MMPAPARLACLLVVAGLLSGAAAFRAPGLLRRGGRATRRSAAVVPALTDVTEPACLEAAAGLKTAALDVAGFSTGPVDTAYLSTGVAAGLAPPLVFLHGFDSSCLEFRRVLPLLEAAGVEAYAFDLAGWGFTDTSAMTAVSVEAKRAQLYAFWKQTLGGRPMCLAGTSLGAAVAIDFFAAHGEAAVASAALLDPQGFIDGAPPIPEFAARGGIKVLQSWPLRSFANDLAYFDPALATDDAIRIGQAHCARPKWEDDSVEWLLGGGYSVSGLVPRLADTPVCVVWGRQDEILPAADYLPKFATALPDAQFAWFDECGHVPHLEQPAALSALLTEFVNGRPIPGGADIAAAAAEVAGGNLLDRINAALDTPILDSNVRGGPLEPVKSFIRKEPEVAQVAASVLAVLFFGALTRAAIGLL